MTPYYDEDGITIYHGDCRELQTPGRSVLVFTDPPYGIQHRTSSYWQNRRIAGDDRPFDPSWLFASYRRFVLWGARHFANYLPPGGGWFVWDKRDRVSRRLPGSDAEMAWTNLHPRVQIIQHLWMPHTMRDEPLLHPNQKPVAVVRRILEEWSGVDDIVFDPYMGSGPVAKACRDLGRRYIGVELEERYCKTAVQRLAQGVLELGPTGKDET